MSKFYTASSQAKELYEEAKTAKEKNKKLNNEVNSCYNISVKDFERSAIHDLFKVYKFHSLLFYSL